MVLDGSVVKMESLRPLSSSVYARAKPEKVEKSEVMFGHAKRSKIHTIERV